MTAFLLIPGAGGASAYWALVAECLRERGHEAIALDLPAGDPAAGLSAYVELAVAAAAGHDDLVVAALSMGAFTAVPACERLAPRRLVLLNAMIPAPGERAGDWGEHTGADAARRAAAQAAGYPDAFDVETYFLHDVRPDVAARAMQDERAEAAAAFEEPCPFARWPDVPTRVLAGRDDRLFPLGFQERVARERLAMAVVPVPGGHLAGLSRPAAVTEALLAA